MKFSIKIILPLVSILILLNACGKRDETPNVPQAESNLVVELFNALMNNDFALATQKLKRLRMLKPNDFSLANIEYQIEMDSGFSGAQKFIDEGKIVKAENLIKKTIDDYGNHEQLVAANNEIIKLHNLKNLINKIDSAGTSSELAVSTGELNRFISENKILESLKPFAEYNLDRAREMMTKEDRMGLGDLRADIDLVRVSNNSILSTMMAQLTLEDEENKEVSAYIELMSEKWRMAKLGQIMNTYEDILYFRKALVSAKKERDELFKEILLTPPGDFSSMLIRAFILEKSGYSTEAGALTEIIKKALGLESYETVGWYSIYPGNVTDYYSINPFVLYPFFVYCVPN